MGVLVWASGGELSNYVLCIIVGFPSFGKH